jgi:hypothetical protein
VILQIREKNRGKDNSIRATLLAIADDVIE